MRVDRHKEQSAAIKDCFMTLKAGSTSFVEKEISAAIHKPRHEYSAVLLSDVSSSQGTRSTELLSPGLNNRRNDA
jgi:hypothetical protein